MRTCLALLLALSSPLAAQDADRSTTFDLVGFVVDHESEQPIPGAEVEVKQLRRRILTDSAGRFEIQRVPEGRYTVLTRRFGYVDSEETSELRSGNVLIISVLPQPLLLEGISVLADQFATRAKSSGFASIVSGRDQLLGSTATSILEFIESHGQVALSECKHSANGCMRTRRSSQPVETKIFLDDMRVTGGVAVIGDIWPRDLYRVEVYPGLGQVRLYTPFYIEMLAKYGMSLPPLCIVC